MAKSVIALVVVLIAIILVSGCTSQSEQTTAPAEKSAAQAQIPSQSGDVWSKTSGYTLEDCNTVCDAAYSIQAQVESCQSSCALLGKPSAQLDKFVNTVKTKVKTQSSS